MNALIERQVQKRAKEVFRLIPQQFDAELFEKMAAEDDRLSRWFTPEQLDETVQQLDNLPSANDRKYWRDAARYLLTYSNEDFLAEIGINSAPHNHVIMKNYNWACDFLDDLREMVRPYVDKSGSP